MSFGPVSSVHLLEEEQIDAWERREQNHDDHRARRTLAEFEVTDCDFVGVDDQGGGRAARTALGQNPDDLEEDYLEEEYFEEDLMDEDYLEEDYLANQT